MVNLKVTLGTVNYTDFLHWTIAKVSDSGTVLQEDWIDVPVTNYNFIIPNLDPENYILSYYDAPTDTDLGELRMQLVVNALTNEFEYEKKYYRCGGSNDGDPIDGEKTITDNYLIEKNVIDVFKEGFRPLKPADEWTFDDSIGEITLDDTITAFSNDEVCVVTLKLAVGVSGSTSGGLYTGTLTIVDELYTLVAGDKNKRIRLLCPEGNQIVTLPALSALNNEDGFYFDNTVGGTTVQVELILPGTDRIYFNGFTGNSDQFASFWVSKGEHLLIKKFTYESVARWEVITDYKGVNVGERIAAGFRNHPNTLPENGALLSLSGYGRVAYWLKYILPSTHKIIDDTITSGGWTRPANKNGLFAVNSDYSFMRMPDTRALSEKGLTDFDTYGGDTERLYDYPGGLQNDANKKFWTGDFATLNILKVDGTNTETSTDSIGPTAPNIRTGVPVDQSVFKNEVRVTNVGVIYLRRI